MFIDKRIIKTRSRIKTAFMQLMLESDAGNITISSLTKKANINRTTFYLHYGDINAVMKDIENEMENKIQSCIDCFDIKSIYESTHTVFTNLTNFLNQSPDARNYIIKSSASDYMIKRIKQILVNKTISALKINFPQLQYEKIIFPITFASSGTIDTYVEWANSENPAISLNELIDNVSKLTQNIFRFINVK